MQVGMYSNIHYRLSTNQLSLPVNYRDTNVDMSLNIIHILQEMYTQTQQTFLSSINTT